MAMAQKRKVPCEVYSRIVGYLRPVQNWNLGKKREWEDRVVYNQPTAERLGKVGGKEPET